MKTQIVEIVTNKILDALDKGTPPWDAGWKFGMHKNFANGYLYRGINRFILQVVAHDQGYDRPLWVTYNKAAEMGGRVKKGEHGTQVVLWKMIHPKDAEDPDKLVPLLRYYTVFNVAQVEGIELPPLVVPDTFPTAEATIEGYKSKPIIKKDVQGKAYYKPASDEVHTPPLSGFETSDNYYSVLFHELIHSTGHSSRLNRPSVMSPSFGSEPYAKEELVAEMGAAILCQHCGITRLIPNQAAYCKSWLGALRDDRAMIISAATQAEKAANLILNVQMKEEE